MYVSLLSGLRLTRVSSYVAYVGILGGTPGLRRSMRGEGEGREFAPLPAAGGTLLNADTDRGPLHGQ